MAEAVRRVERRRDIYRAMLELDNQRIIYQDEQLELLRLQTEAEGVGGSGYGDELHRQTSGGDRLQVATAKLSAYKDKIKQLRRLRSPRKIEALATLYRELSPAEAYVAEAIYNRGLNYKQIAEELGYSVRWAYLQQERTNGHVR